jgi:hypothetical protein
MAQETSSPIRSARRAFKPSDTTTRRSSKSSAGCSIGAGFFGMELTGSDGDSDIWTWKPFWDDHDRLVDKYNDLVKRWNRAVPVINAETQNVGRPLAADEDEVAIVLSLHKRGSSLREIAFELELGLQTVRTIVGRKNFTDRTSNKRRKIAVDQHERAHWKSQKRTGDALPKRVQAVIETGHALVQEAKGLGRGR